MSFVTEHPISRRWPAKNPEVIQLYSYPTPNGIKVSTMLEETGLPYEAHKVTLSPEEVRSPEFGMLSPNNKIPAIIDPDGPGGRPLPMFESGAILIYLAEKTGRFMPTDPIARYEVLQWLMWQMGGVGPMFGQFGFFFTASDKEIEEPRALQRYAAETRRLLAVLDRQLNGRDWITGEYTIADIAVAPWLRVLLARYHAADILEWDKFDNVPRYLERFLARPAVAKAVNIPPRE